MSKAKRFLVLSVDCPQCGGGLFEAGFAGGVLYLICARCKANLPFLIGDYKKALAKGVERFMLEVPPKLSRSKPSRRPFSEGREEFIAGMKNYMLFCEETIKIAQKEELDDDEALRLCAGLLTACSQRIPFLRKLEELGYIS